MWSVDIQTKLIHSVVGTAANVAHIPMLPALLHGGRRKVWGDHAYQGPAATIRIHAPKPKTG